MPVNVAVDKRPTNDPLISSGAILMIQRDPVGIKSPVPIPPTNKPMTMEMYPDDYNFGKDELNGLGVRLRNAGKFDEAIEIYNWIIEIDPDWVDGYNGIADVYRLKGDKELAIKYYAKSLEMNPEMWYARGISEMLKELTEEDD